MPRKQIDALTETARLFKAKGLVWIALSEDGTVRSPAAKFLGEETMRRITAAMGAEKGDLLLFCADQEMVVCSALGSVRLELGRKLNLIDESRHAFGWITDFPMFEFSAEENRYVAMHHPFTMPKEEDLPYLLTDPVRVRAKAYDIVLNGFEMGGGSIRIHQKEVQEKVFAALGFTPDEAREKFGFFLEALGYGTPPHGGLAYGLDRMIMLISGEENIRDVIAFPKVKDASCPMSGAPDRVDPKQLEELGISITEQAK